MREPTYNDAAHLQAWEPVDDGGPEPEQHYCQDCGERIAAPGARCLNCYELDDASDAMHKCSRCGDSMLWWQRENHDRDVCPRRGEDKATGAGHAGRACSASFWRLER